MDKHMICISISSSVTNLSNLLESKTLESINSIIDLWPVRMVTVGDRVLVRGIKGESRHQQVGVSPC
jgi:hypothetical protein